MPQHQENKARLRRRVLAVMTATVVIGATAVASALPAAAATVRPTAVAEVPAFPITPIGPERDPNKPDVVVIDAGGTLTARARDRISYLHYSGSVEGGVQTILQDMYPELAAVANLEVVAAGGLGGSSGVRNATLYNVSRTIDAQLARDEVDGVVVTAGTNVLEEDAYFFDLTVQSDKPVVVTGSMHQYGTFTYDAYTNLFSSIRLAASAKTTCFGTVVLLGDQFHTARDVTKTDGYRMDTFETRAYGALGVVNEDNIRVLRAPSRVVECGTDGWKTPFDLRTIAPTALPIVDIVYGYVEASAGTVTGPVAAGARGLVTAGHGPGGMSYLQTPAIREVVAQGVTVVSTSRTGGEGTYDSGAGNIGGADLLPQKARLLLQLGLAFGGDVEQIRTWFTSIGSASFDMSGAAVAPEPEPTTEPTTEPTGPASPEPTGEPSPETSASPDPSATAVPGAAMPGSGGSGGGLASTGSALGIGGVTLAALLAAAAGSALYIRARRRRLDAQPFAS